MVNFNPGGLMFSLFQTWIELIGVYHLTKRSVTSEEKVSFEENTHFPQNHILQKSMVFRVLTDGTKN